MYLNTLQPQLISSSRVLIVSEERTIREDLQLSHALQNNIPTGSSSTSLTPGNTLQKPKSSPNNPEVLSTANEKEALAWLEAGVQEHRPFSLVVIDGRLLYGKDYRQFIRRFWQIQRDLHIVLHAVSQLDGFEQIPIELGSHHQLLVLKFRLVPFEITQLVRTLTTKHNSDSQTSQRNLSLNAQLLEATTRFEDVSNRLRMEQDHRRQLEDKLCRNQRLETVGRFADAMAHFFNNYLTVIRGHLEVAAAAQEQHVTVPAVLRELLVATQHAAGVTSQFVAFNRREYLQPAPLHLPQIIDAQTALVQKALGENIAVQIQHKSDLPCVMADQASVEQIIFNLLIHARDSMPDGGRLMIQTRQLSIPDMAAAAQTHPDAVPGNYVSMVLSDTGKGMTAGDLSRLFDATHLDSNHDGGADIALILVQGLVRLQGGWISAGSVLDVGTEFSVFLPVAASGAVPAPMPPERTLLPPPSASETSTILIVDDEDSVRQVMEYVLTSQGHQVLCASDANEAWSLWRSKAAVIKLAIIDVKLPGGVSGFDLEKAIANEDPTLPVIFTCGYAQTSLGSDKELKTGENFLPKPFGMVELLNIVGQALLTPARL